MSHPLPLPVQVRLRRFATDLDEAFQAEGFKVTTVTELDPAFDRGWLISDLIRAKLCQLADDLLGKGLTARELAKSGYELIHEHDEVRRLFRVKSATRDRHDGLIVNATSDSVLSRQPIAPPPTLFDDEKPLPSFLYPVEQWVLAVEINRTLLTVEGFTAARAVGFVNGMPGRLVLADITPIPFGGGGGGGSFKSGSNDKPLAGEELWGEDEGSGEEGVG